MKYYEIMLNDMISKSSWMVCHAGEFRNEGSFNRYAIYEGRPIEDWKLPLSFYYIESEGSFPVDYMASDIGWELISPRFKDILINLEAANLQFIPIEIYERDTKNNISGYSIINITQFTDAIDFDKSIFSMNTVEATGLQYYSFIKSALFTNKLTEHNHIFRTSENRFSTFVSESVRKAAKKNKLIGCDFLEVLSTED